MKKTNESLIKEISEETLNQVALAAIEAGYDGEDLNIIFDTAEDFNLGIKAIYDENDPDHATDPRLLEIEKRADKFLYTPPIQSKIKPR